MGTTYSFGPIIGHANSTVSTGSSGMVTIGGQGTFTISSQTNPHTWVVEEEFERLAKLEKTVELLINHFDLKDELEAYLALDMNEEPK